MLFCCFLVHLLCVLATSKQPLELFRHLVGLIAVLAHFAKRHTYSPLHMSHVLSARFSQDGKKRVVNGFVVLNDFALRGVDEVALSLQVLDLVLETTAKSQHLLLHRLRQFLELCIQIFLLFLVLFMFAALAFFFLRRLVAGPLTL